MPVIWYWGNVCRSVNVFLHIIDFGMYCVRETKMSSKWWLYNITFFSNYHIKVFLAVQDTRILTINFQGLLYMYSKIINSRAFKISMHQQINFFKEWRLSVFWVEKIVLFYSFFNMLFITWLGPFPPSSFKSV